MEREKESLSGVLLLIKPAGMTSHDLVEVVRSWTRTRRAGHTGTLDPLASGLMLICLGRATRFAEYFSELEKVYRFEVVFGIRTTTQDAGGEIISRSDCSDLTEETVRSLLPKFTGEIEQIPPMQSALHYHGRRLYQLAKKGIVVPRSPRKVIVRRLELIRFFTDRPKRALMEVACTRGTYIRTLASDIGDALGCGAYQHFLVRLKVGPFSIGQALTLEELEEKAHTGSVTDVLLPVDQALAPFPPLPLSSIDSQRLLHGMDTIVGTIWGHPGLKDGSLTRLYGPGGTFIGVGELRRRGNLWICLPKKMMPAT